MSFAQFKKIIDEIGTYLISIDFFNWGEPLLNKDDYRMIGYAHKQKIVTTISSNFQHFSERGADEMISSGLDNLILSIDGASQESYEKYRIGGNFQKAIDNISTLVKKKRESGVNHPYIYWQFLVMKHNEHEIEKASEMARELGVDTIGIDPAYLPVETREIAMQCLPSNSKYHRYNLEELEKKWQAQENQTQSPQPSDTPSTVSYKRLINCSWLWTQTTINWDGGISPCCAIWDPSHDFGNITGSSFKEVWNNDKYRASRIFSAKGEVDKTLTTCMICPFASHG
jgi:radical SAM protein with 4Fe4S-binding SPASM domain